MLTPSTFISQSVTDAMVVRRTHRSSFNVCVEAGMLVEAHIFPHGPRILTLATAETTAAGNTAQIEQNAQVWPTL
ncbi:hypothetical protein [Bifidobacterium sp. ESL0732]|uniref:hypothetical protein n=1 Tax=Bifidobacterium sp. ESL0732 TaxID=2983222 RepID=UPI0023F65815|nr:hypothetical protein [Bifidobacterium sp. ESL0732]WEV64174.1 hypothetical protein OZX70_00830 [Bifidobacterium sp. ESL0732]